MYENRSSINSANLNCSPKCIKYLKQRRTIQMTLHVNIFFAASLDNVYSIFLTVQRILLTGTFLYAHEILQNGVQLLALDNHHQFEKEAMVFTGKTGLSESQYLTAPIVCIFISRKWFPRSKTTLAFHI